MRNTMSNVGRARRACLGGVITARALLSGVALAPLMLAPLAARAQTGGPTITYPQEGAPLRGTVKVLFEGVPEGGNAMVYVDLTPTNRDRAFRSSVTSGIFNLDTFPLAEGRHSVTIVSFNANGKRLGQTTINFEVANSSIDPGAEAVRLVNWTLRDRVLGQVQRYRIEAESNATITGGASASGGSSSGSGGPGGSSGDSSGGGADGGESTIPAPLDWQVNMLVRRIVRDVGLLNNSANIKLVVKDAFQRQREDASGKSGGPGGSSGGSSRKARKGPPSKAPWGTWEPAPEVGQYFVKMITAAGAETNATRKPFTVALGDILPLFPEEAVRPGSPWQTEITLVTELSKRAPVTVSIPMRFTSFETFQTPAGAARRCARLETGRQPLPDNIAMKIARVLQASGGSKGGAGGASGGSSSGAPSGGGGEGADAAEPAAITVARSTVSRVLWFDVAAHRVLRSEDLIDTYYEEEAPEAPEGGGSSSGGGGPSGFGGGSSSGGPSGFGGPSGSGGAEGAAPAEPSTVTYNLRVVKFLDDNIPPPTDDFNAGVGTAHSRDSVKDPSLARVMGKP